MNGVYKTILLGISPYDFKQDNGEQIKGATAHYVVIGENLPNGVGLKPTKSTLPYEDFSKYAGLELPCFADLKGVMRLSNMKFEPESFSNFEALTKQK